VLTAACKRKEVKEVVFDICIALYYELLASKALRYGTMLTNDHTDLPATQTLMHVWNEPYLPLLLSRRASLHFGRYSFPSR